MLFTLVRPGILLDMSDDLPRSVTAGIYPSERAGEVAFAWSHPLATVTLRSLDRTIPWTCTITARGARPPQVPAAEVTIGVDGVNTATLTLDNTFRDIQVSVPPREMPGVALTISTAVPFVPGPGDSRQLGVQIDSIGCQPAASFVMPPREALGSALVAGGLFGWLFAASLTTWVAVLLMLLFGAASGTLLTTGGAPFISGYLGWWGPVAASATLPVLGWTYLRTGVPAPTRGVVAVLSAILCLKILALLHPSKDVVDAVFHARRLGWVLDGRYYFTQPMPGGVQFPYAIGLYVTAAPFASLVRDHVALLRIVVCVAEAFAALAVYAAVARTAGDRTLAALSAVLYHAAPVPYVVIGNANLTFAFGQSIAVIATCTAILLRATPSWGATLGLFAVAALGYLSHVAVFPLLAVTLVLLAGQYWWSRDEGGRRAGVMIGSAAVIAAVLAVGIYYAHFPEVWSRLDRITAAETATPAAQPMPSVGQRAARAATLGVRFFGIPLVILAAAGAVVMARSREHQMRPAIIAWLAAMVLFLASRTVAPVDPSLQRYADEFIDRVYYLTLPAIALLAGIAVAWGLRAGALYKAAAGLVFGLAALGGVNAWLAWLR